MLMCIAVLYLQYFLPLGIKHSDLFTESRSIPFQPCFARAEELLFMCCLAPSIPVTKDDPTS